MHESQAAPRGVARNQPAAPVRFDAFELRVGVVRVVLQQRGGVFVGELRERERVFERVDTREEIFGFGLFRGKEESLLL